MSWFKVGAGLWHHLVVPLKPVPPGRWVSTCGRDLRGPAMTREEQPQEMGRVCAPCRRTLRTLAKIKERLPG